MTKPKRTDRKKDKRTDRQTDRQMDDTVDHESNNILIVSCCLVVASAAKEGRHLALQNLCRRSSCQACQARRHSLSHSKSFSLDEISDMLVPQSAARQGLDKRHVANAGCTEPERLSLAVAFAAKPDWLARSLPCCTATRVLGLLVSPATARQSATLACEPVEMPPRLLCESSSLLQHPEGC